MERFSARWLWQILPLCLFCTLPLTAGCGSGGGDTPAAKSSATPGEGEADSLELPTRPEDLPTLEALKADKQWEEMPVVDAMAKLRELWADRQPSVQEAAEVANLRNDSPEANERIINTLGFLPEDPARINSEATIRRHLRGDVNSTNPIMINSTAEFDVSGLISFGLFGFDWEMSPFASADTVVSWQSSADRLVDIVVMRDDLTWSDGKPITAHDVAFSFLTIMDPNINVPAVRSGTDKLRWVEAYDDHTLAYFHKEPSAVNVWNVNFPILPKHVYEPILADDPSMKQSAAAIEAERNPVVGGAYKLTSWDRGQRLVLERREDWYMHNGQQVREIPFFKRVQFDVILDTNTALLALKSGDLDEMELLAPQWQGRTSGDDFYQHNTRTTAPRDVYFYFGWNAAIPLFEDVRVRRAMSLAFDHKEMLNTLLYGLYAPCHGIFPPDSWMMVRPTDPIFNTQNIAEAEQLLSEAGWEDTDGDGIRDKVIGGRKFPFEFTLLVSTDDERIRICNLMRECLSRVGISCTVRPLEPTTLMDSLMNRKFQAYFAGWGAGADPYTSENIFGTGEARNYVGFSDPDVDRLFKEGRNEFELEKRAEIYTEIAEIVYDQQPYTFLYYQSGFWGMNKNLRGTKYSSRGPYHFSPGFSSVWMTAE